MRRVLAISGLCILGIASTLTGTSAAQGGGATGRVPASLNQMIDEVNFIAEVSVESVFPPAAQRQQANPGQIGMHRDALLRVTRVLKGSEPSSQIVWAGEFGSPLGVNSQSPYPLINVGRSLIIFVRKAPKELVDRLAERTQPRYDGRHGRTGIVEIDKDGNMHLNDTLPFKAQYEGKAKSLMIADVESRVRATR